MNASPTITYSPPWKPSVSNNSSAMHSPIHPSRLSNSPTANNQRFPSPQTNQNLQKPHSNSPDPRTRGSVYQSAAKNMLQNPPKTPQNNSHAPAPAPKSQKIPVYIPTSVIRKAKRLPPPTIYKSLPNGEVIAIHLVGETAPIYDPIVHTSVTVDSTVIQANPQKKPGISMLPTYNKPEPEKQEKRRSKHSRSQPASSIPPHLAPPPDLYDEPKPVTPRNRMEYLVFRDIPREDPKPEPKRAWVANRMKAYYNTRIKQQFQPKIDPLKKIEMQILQEKNSKRISYIPKVKLMKLAKNND